MHFLIRMIVIILYMLVMPIAFADKDFSLDLKDVYLPDAIHIIARYLHVNVMISSSVSGMVSIHLQQTDPFNALELLLTSNGLAKWRMGSIWYVAPRDELIKRKQEELKWQEVRDASARLITKVWSIQYGKAEDIAKLIQDDHHTFVSKRAYVRVDARTNMICIQDIAERIQEIDRLIRRLDVPVKQILIEARLASVDDDCERALGMYFEMKTVSSEAKHDTVINKEKTGRYTISVVKLADGAFLDVKLAALEAAGHAELISHPSLFTSNQQTAFIEAGEEVPYQEVSESGGTAVVFKKAVLGLKVTPQILPNNRVLLELQVNQDRPSSRMILGVPAITTRQIKTSIIVKAGQTAVLGGVYESQQEKGEESVPFMSHLPLLGYLFKLQNSHVSKRELLIFVTPKVI